MKKQRTYEKKAANKNGLKRAIFVGISIIIEMVLLVTLFTKLNKEYEWISIATRLLETVLVMGIYAQHKTSSMKMPWIIFILAFPAAGITFYLLTGLAGSTKKMSLRYKEVDKKLLPMLPENEETFHKLHIRDKGLEGISKYLYLKASYPIYENTDITFYNMGEKGLDAQLEDIGKAKDFIFMEYHAIEDAESWARIENVLERKAQEGVEVRVFYDDVGSITFINWDFAKRLESKGIKVRVFNPVGVFFNLFLNNRDHRKITVVDGKVGFVGGYNLANEYFNVTHPYGMWKDTGIRIEGDAVKSLTISFLEMWNAVRDGDKDDENVAKYLVDYGYTAASNGFVQPYADSPMDDEHVGEEVYINIINSATDYCYFITPYLIITDEMSHALSLAAKRGVDVRIITPGIPDKKIVYSVTRSFYNALVRNGVKIYEWTPGFAHAKMCISDDRIATVGTINLDYRSLYHHFENGCVIYLDNVIREIKADFINTFAESRDVTEEYLTGRSRFMRLGQMLLRLFAELL